MVQCHCVAGKNHLYAMFLTGYMFLKVVGNQDKGSHGGGRREIIDCFMHLAAFLNLTFQTLVLVFT